MAVAASDMKFRLSGGGANSNPNASLGGAISSVDLVDNVAQNLFDNISGAEAAAGETSYRCLYVKNNHATDDADDVTIWVQSNTPSANTTIAIGADPAGVNGTATTIANEFAAPAGVTFSTPTDLAGGINLGDLTEQDYAAVWIRRTVTAGAASVSSDPATLRINVVPL